MLPDIGAEACYVSGSGRTLAWQQKNGATESVAWEYRDLSGASVRAPGGALAGGGSAELEPLGSNAGLVNLVSRRPPEEELTATRTYPSIGDALSPECNVDGVDMPCFMVSSEAQVPCPNNDCGPRWNAKKKVFEYFRAFADGRSGYVPADARFSGNRLYSHEAATQDDGTIDELEGFIVLGQTQQYPAPSIPLGDLFQNIADILANDRCNKFISALITKAEEVTGISPYSTSAAQLVNKVAGLPYGGYKFEDNKGGGGSAFGAIARGEATAKFGSKAPRPESTLTPELIRNTQLDYALRAIHEAIHLAGGAASAYNGYGVYYTDEVLAEAARRLTGAPGFPTDVDPKDPYKVYKYGGYWDRQLREHCLPSSK